MSPQVVVQIEISDSADLRSRQYTGFDNTRKATECWFAAHPTEGVDPNNIAQFNNIVDDRYAKTVGEALMKAGIAEGSGAPNYLDHWQKLLCRFMRSMHPVRSGFSCPAIST